MIDFSGKKTSNLSVKDEVKLFCEKNKRLLSAYSVFTAEDMEYLQKNKAVCDTLEYKFIIQKYNVYLYGIVEDFERGPCGLKRNLDKDGRLNVLPEKDNNRMMSLARDFTRNVLQDADYDEFCILYEQFDESLHKMAIKAQERGLVCWILQDTEQNLYDCSWALRGSGLRKRAVVYNK